MNKEKILIESLIQTGCYYDINKINKIILNYHLPQKKIRKLAYDNNTNLDWKCISRNQRLSSEFIYEFKDRVDWKCISIYQKLTKEFRIEFADRLNNK